MLPVAFGLAALGLEIIKVIYGEKWIPAVDGLRILIIFGVCRSFVALNGYVFYSLGKPNICFYFNTARMILVIVLIYPLTLKHGLTGAALAVTIPIVLQFLVDVVIFTKVIGLTMMKIVKH